MNEPRYSRVRYVPGAARSGSAVPRRREQGHCEPGLAQIKSDWDFWSARSLAAEPIVRRLDGLSFASGSIAGHVDLAARGHWRARGRPRAARGQNMGGEFASLALRSRRSDRARPAAAGLSHRRWRAGIRESDRRRLWRAGEREVHKHRICLRTRPSACMRKSAPTIPT